MSAAKWTALLLVIVVLWIDTAVVVLLFKHTLLGAVFAIPAIPLSIGVYEEFISCWRES